jgi:hypothetical protein
MDEAWFISWAREEVAAADPLSGMTRYTGILPYLLLKLTGTEHGLLVLRGVGVLCNGLALLLLLSILRRLYPRSSVLLWATPVLATLPVWLIFARSGIETCQFGPLLTVLGLRLLFAQGPLPCFAAGACWGLMAYNHLLGAFVPISFGIAWWVVYRRLPPVRWRAASVGFVVGFAPRLAALVLYRDAALEGSAADYALSSALLDLLFVPWALWNTLDGSFPVLRFVGKEALPIGTYWLLPVAFTVWFHWRGGRIPKAAKFVLLAALLLAFLRTLPAPSIQSHYMLESSIMVVVFFVQVGIAARGERFRRLPLVPALAVLVTIANLTYFVANYQVPWRHPRTIAVNTFAIGSRNKHASNRDVLPKRELLRTLEELGVRQAIASASIERPLRVITAGTSLRVGRPDAFDEAERASALVVFFSESPKRRRCIDERVCFDRPTPVRRQFVVYTRVGHPSKP